MYPKLAEARENGQPTVAEAVEFERQRVKAPSIPAADTELGRELQKKLGLPASLANEAVSRETENVLKKFKRKGKPVQ